MAINIDTTATRTQNQRTCTNVVFPDPAMPSTMMHVGARASPLVPTLAVCAVSPPSLAIVFSCCILAYEMFELKTKLTETRLEFRHQMFAPCVSNIRSNIYSTTTDESCEEFRRVEMYKNNFPKSRQYALVCVHAQLYGSQQN
jgi:hypothetical protein